MRKTIALFVRSADSVRWHGLFHIIQEGMMHWVRHSALRGACLRAAGLVALFTLLVGCDDAPADSQAVSGSFVGRVTGTDAFVTVVTNGTDVRAYVCDGTPVSELTISAWFKGTQTDNAIDFPSLSGAARIVADVSPLEVTGRIERSGQPYLNFTASLAEGTAGFYLYKYEHDGQRYWAGWIVLPGEEMRGSMAEPTRTSLDVSLNVATNTAQIPGIGSVNTARLTSGKVTAGFNGGCCCCN